MTIEQATDAPTPTRSPEVAELLGTLAQQRWFLRYTVRELTEEQIRLRPTASALCLGGLVKHVTAMEQRWVSFIVDGPAAISGADPAAVAEHAAGFEVLPTETLAGLLARNDEVAARTERVVDGLPDLGRSHPLPEAPWFPPGARWSARRVLLHLIGETAQHAGHADILRESIDGARTMG